MRSSMKLCNGIFVRVSIFLLCICQTTSEIQIGALFEHGQEDLQTAFTEAVRFVNDNRRHLINATLVPNIETIANGDCFEAYRKVCGLLSRGVVAIFGPQYSETSAQVESICTAMEIPNIIAQLPHSFVKLNSSIGEQSYTFNMAPYAPDYYRLFSQIVGKLKWASYAIIYDDVNGLIRNGGLLSLPKSSSNVTAYQLPSGDDYREFLLEIQRQDQYNLIIDCSINKSLRLLTHSQQIGMMDERHNFLLINAWDVQEKDFEEFRYSKSTILYATSKMMLNTYTKFNIQTKIFYDSVLLFALLVYGQEKLFEERSEASCETEKTWSSGRHVRYAMHTVQGKIERGTIDFFKNQHISIFDVYLMSLDRTGIKPVGNYTIDQYGIHVNTENIEKPAEAPQALNVLAVLSEPYIRLKKNADNEDVYEGYCIDILKEISKIHGFRFNVSQVHANAYGYLHPETGQFVGIIGELVKKNAAMGIGDLSITKNRHAVVDFSYPIMDVGIIALLRKPNPEDQNSIFYFLTPFSTDIWIALAASYLGSCALLFVLARINPTEWHNPHPCAKNSESLANDLGLSNSLWFMLASLLRQYSTITPKGISTRIVAVVWWTFAIVLFCFYMANLVKNQVLSVEKLESPIRNIYDLASQSKIKYGIVRRGSTMEFFRNTNIEVYKEMWSIMSADEQNHPNQSSFVSSTSEGINRVKQGDYAFFMETSLAEYIAERDCSLMTVGPQLDHKAHGFAFPKGSPYTEPISAAILKLQQTGILRRLQSKWWEHGKSRDHCDDKIEKIKTINSRHLGGLFILLLSTLPLACLVAIVEVIWNWKTANPSKKSNTLRQEMQQQFTSAVNFKQTTKRVQERPSILEENQSQELNEEESRNLNLN